MNTKTKSVAKLVKSVRMGAQHTMNLYLKAAKQSSDPQQTRSLEVAAIERALLAEQLELVSESNSFEITPRNDIPTGNTYQKKSLAEANHQLHRELLRLKRLAANFSPLQTFARNAATSLFGLGKIPLSPLHASVPATSSSM